MITGTGTPAFAIAAILALGLGGPAPAQHGAVFVTASGQSVQLEPVESLDCVQLLAKMDEIDATGYRGLRPTPRKAEDRRLLAYEKAVSRRYYTRCGFGGQDDSAADVLSSGLAAPPRRD